MSLTLRPGGAFREIDFGLPRVTSAAATEAGWSTAFIATPRTFGHFVPRAFILWYFFTGLDERLLRPSAAGDDTDGGSTLRVEPPDLRRSLTTATLRSLGHRHAR